MQNWYGIEYTRYGLAIVITVIIAMIILFWASFALMNPPIESISGGL